MHRGSVVFLLNSLEIGGSEAKTVRLVNALARRGRPVHIVYLNARDSLLRELDPEVPGYCLRRRGKLSLKALIRLLRYVRDHRVHTVVAINLYPSVYSSAVKRLFPSARVRNLVAVNTTDHIGTKSKLQMLLYSRLLRNASGAIFGCKAQMEQWLLEYGLPASHCTVVYNGVDIDRFAPTCRGDKFSDVAKDSAYSTEDFVVGTVGVLRREKAQGDLVEAVRRLKDKIPGVRGLVVGSGPEKDALDRQVRAAGLDDRVTFLGAVRDVRPALDSMDVFVLPSIAVETFSNAALEAMAMAKPVILSDIGGAREMITDRASGRIYPKGRVDILTEILLELWADPGQRRALGWNARKEVEERFSFTRMLMDYERLLDWSRS